MTRTPEVGRPGPAPATHRAVARWVELAHEIVAETGDAGADAAVDAAVDWVAAALVGGTAPAAVTLPRPGAPGDHEGSAASCSGAASRLLTLAAEVEAHADAADGPEWNHQVRELAQRLQQHATLLAVDPSDPGRSQALGMSAARVRRAALACRLPRGGPALPFRP